MKNRMLAVLFLLAGCASAPSTEGQFPVTVDYSLSYQDRIRTGGFRRVMLDVLDEGAFPVSGEGLVDCTLELVHVGRRANTAEVLDVLYQRGLEPARIEHLIAFASRYRDQLLKYIIIAPGSSRVIVSEQSGGRAERTVYAGAVGSEHGFPDPTLGALGARNGWPSSYVFLAVRH